MLQQLLILITGFFAGAVHVMTGPDHLAAIAPLTADQPAKSWKIGLWWGIGHTASVWLIGAAIFLLRAAIPIEAISSFGEKLVGILLIALGLWALKKALSNRVVDQPHEHEGKAHSHFHLASLPHRHSHLSLNIGLLHGLAGSSHFLAILPALTLPGTAGAIVYVAGFGLGTIVAMILFSWAIGTAVRRFFWDFKGAYQKAQIGVALAALAIGAFWLLSPPE